MLARVSSFGAVVMGSFLGKVSDSRVIRLSSLPSCSYLLVGHPGRPGISSGRPGGLSAPTSRGNAPISLPACLRENEVNSEMPRIERVFEVDFLRAVKRPSNCACVLALFVMATSFPTSAKISVPRIQSTRVASNPKP